MNGLAWSGAVANNNNSNKTMMAGNSIIPGEVNGHVLGDGWCLAS